MKIANSVKIAFGLFSLSLLGCAGQSADPSPQVNALTGEACTPSANYMPKAKKPAKNPKCQGTSVGDNCDDLSSGKIDCIGDGNSGQGDDKKHNCEFPQPGCDENGCCDSEIVEDPDDGDTDGDGDGDIDGDGDNDGVDEPDDTDDGVDDDGDGLTDEDCDHPDSESDPGEPTEPTTPATGDGID